MNKKADLSRVAVRVSLILAVTVAMFVARLSTGAPTFKPIDNAASFADSLVTRVSWEICKQILLCHNGINPLWFKWQILVCMANTKLLMSNSWFLGSELQLYLCSECLAAAKSMVVVFWLVNGLHTPCELTQRLSGGCHRSVLANFYHSNFILCASRKGTIKKVMSRKLSV